MQLKDIIINLFIVFSNSLVVNISKCLPKQDDQASYQVVYFIMIPITSFELKMFRFSLELSTNPINQLMTASSVIHNSECRHKAFSRSEEILN